MTKTFKIRNGGVYLVNFGKTIGAEFTTPHYCVVLKTHDKGLVMVFPMTSKDKIDKYTCEIPESNSTCILKHTKTLSVHRVLRPLINYVTGQPVIVTPKTLENLWNKYKEYVNDTCKKAIIGNKFINTNITINANIEQVHSIEFEPRPIPKIISETATDAIAETIPNLDEKSDNM